MHTITLPRVLSPEETAERGGRFLRRDPALVLGAERQAPLRVERESDGTPLFVWLPGWLAEAPAQAALPCLIHATRSAKTFNRGMAGGNRLTPSVRKDKRPIARSQGSVRYYPMKRDGTISRTTYAAQTPSAVVGYFERQSRWPFCRQTAYYARHFAEVNRLVLPLLKQANAAFARFLPGRYRAQYRACQQTDPHYLLPGTVFSTITVNHNWQTALHQDAGDFQPGFGVMLSLQRGAVDGGALCFPAYDVGVRLGHGDVLLCDVHEWHANTALRGRRSTFDRVTVVAYYRDHMINCLAPPEELAFARGLENRAHLNPRKASKEIET